MGNHGIRQHIENSGKTGVFHLSKAKLQQFPPELVNLVGVLRSIDLSENKIVTIPDNIGVFVNLKVLNLSHNNIERMPEQLGTLTKLETLCLSSNRIRSVASSLQKLPKLRDVNLSENQINAFPKAFCGIKSLTVIDLSKNRITEIPSGVGDLQVVELILNSNQIKRISDDLAQCPNLKTLRLQENCLSLADFPVKLLTDSQISLVTVEGNLFDMKQFAELEGYEKYMERYTATKKKLM